MRQSWPLLVLAAALACGRGSDDRLSPNVRQYAITDPQGDTLASPYAVSRAHDVLNLEATPQGDTLFVSLRFANLVQPFSSRATNALLGIIDFDIDDDPATGVLPIADQFGATSRLGAEWSLFLEDSTVADGGRRVALRHIATGEVFWIPGSFDGTAVVAHVPLARLQAREGSNIRMVGVLGNVERPSDFVPNEGSMLIALP
jgi:hypothetical protein